jgi:hypothetical protein
VPKHCVNLDDEMRTRFEGRDWFNKEQKLALWPQNADRATLEDYVEDFAMVVAERLSQGAVCTPEEAQKRTR